MMRLVARLGATIPGVKPFDAEPQSVIKAARASWTELEETDELERSEAAERAVARADDDASCSVPRSAWSHHTPPEDSR